MKKTTSTKAIPRPGFADRDAAHKAIMGTRDYKNMRRTATDKITDSQFKASLAILRSDLEGMQEDLDSAIVLMMNVRTGFTEKMPPHYDASSILDGARGLVEAVMYRLGELSDPDPN